MSQHSRAAAEQSRAADHHITWRVAAVATAAAAALTADRQNDDDVTSPAFGCLAMAGSGGRPAGHPTAILHSTLGPWLTWRIPSAAGAYICFPVAPLLLLELPLEPALSVPWPSLLFLRPVLHVAATLVRRPPPALRFRVWASSPPLHYQHLQAWPVIDRHPSLGAATHLFRPLCPSLDPPRNGLQRASFLMPLRSQMPAFRLTPPYWSARSQR